VLGVDNIVLARLGKEGWAKADAVRPPNVPTDLAGLTKALSDPDPVVRGLAARALQKMGAAAAHATAALSARLKDPDPNVRQAGAEALGAIGPAASSAVPSLIAECSVADDSVHVLRACAAALGDIGPAASAALPTLRKIAANPIPHVGGVIDLTPAWAASRAIEKIEGKKPK
jgi:HEAT repeat protein